MTEMNLIIDKEKCVKCGLCIKDCSAKSIAFGEDGFPVVAQNGEKRCFKCQHCLSICPTGALSILGKNPEDSNSVENSINPDDLLNLIQSRRSVRHYKHENIAPEKMEKLKNMLKYVPTGCNNHGLHFSVIDDVEVMDKFREKINKRVINVISNNTVKLVTKKFGHYIDAMKNGEDILFRTAPHMVVVSVEKNAPCKDIDPTIALSYFELYAQSMGIGTCWCGLVYWLLTMMPELQGLLEIPETHKIGYVMLFGNPENKYTRTPQPKDVPIVSVKKDGKELNLTFIQKVKRIFGK